MDVGERDWVHRCPERRPPVDHTEDGEHEERAADTMPEECGMRPLAGALAEIQERNERRIRDQLFTEWTVENDVPEGDVRRLLAALGQAMNWVPREEHGRFAAMLRKGDAIGGCTQEHQEKTAPPRRHWTAGHLRAALAGVPDDTLIVVNTEDPQHGDLVEEWAIYGAGYGRIDWGDGYGMEQDEAFGLSCRLTEEFRVKPKRPRKFSE
jgi:hypothetical protein